MENLDSFPLHLLRHCYSNDRCHSRAGEYNILATFYHRAGLSDRYDCTWHDSHYHYIILFDAAYVTRQVTSHRPLIAATMCKKIPTTLPLATLISYMEKYEEVDDETVVPKPKKIRLEEATLDNLRKVAARQVIPTRDQKLDEYEANAEKRYQELCIEFPRGEESYREKQAKYKRAAARSMLEIDWKLYKSELLAETEFIKSTPITEEEFTQMTSFPIFQREIPRIVKKIKRFICEEKKVPIIILHGVSNSGKSKYMKLISQAMGKPCFMQCTALTTDILAMDTAVANNCDVLCFEEFRFVDYQNNVSKALQTLKQFTSGDYQNFRTCKNTRTKGETQLLIKAVWIASNEGREAINQYKTMDPAFAERVVDIWYGKPIPPDERLEPQDYFDNSNLFIKYAVYYWNRDVDESDSDMEEDEEDKEMVKFTAQDIDDILKD